MGAANSRCTTRLDNAGPMSGAVASIDLYALERQRW
jgi:hypothetical protein